VQKPASLDGGASEPELHAFQLKGRGARSDDGCPNEPCPRPHTALDRRLVAGVEVRKHPYRHSVSGVVSIAGGRAFHASTKFRVKGTAAGGAPARHGDCRRHPAHDVALAVYL